MPMFESETADGAWLMAVDSIKKQVALPRQEGRGGRTCELLHVALQINNSRERWVTSRAPGISVAFAIVEIIGILNGRQDSRYLNFFNPRLPRFAGTGTEYHGAYGFRLRQNFGFDQLDRAFDALAHNPNGRQVVLQIWDAARDFPHKDGSPVAKDIPCNVCSLLKIRDGRLEWVQIMRSNDAFKGLPYNLIQFMTLQEVMAGWLRVEPGSYTHFSDSLHLYDDDVEHAFGSVQLGAPSSSDSLAVAKDVADPIWLEMNRRVDKLVASPVSEDDYASLAHLAGAPQGFTNLMSIVVADAARRHGNTRAAHAAASVCTNPQLLFLWDRWAEWKKVPRPESELNLDPRKRMA
jgi:thymidylate synthase